MLPFTIKSPTSFKNHSILQLCTSIRLIKKTTTISNSKLLLIRCRSDAATTTKNPTSYTISKINTSLPWKIDDASRMTKYGSKMSNRRIFKNSFPIIPSILNYVQDVGLGIPPEKPMKGTKPIRREDILQTSQPPFLSSGSYHEISNIKYEASQIPIKTYNIKSYNQDEYTSLHNNKITIPEIAIAGRFKVGKPEVLNTLLHYNSNPIVSTSSLFKKKVPFQRPKFIKKIKAASKPKRKQSPDITLYQLTNKLKTREKVSDLNDTSSKTLYASLRIADLPGYDFANSTSFDETKVNKWKEELKHYIINRGKYLKRILLLVDCRYGLRETDAEFFMYLKSYFNLIEDDDQTVKDLPPIQIVLTKCEKSKQVDLASRISQVTKQLEEILSREHPIDDLPVMLVGRVVRRDDGPKLNNSGGIFELQRELSSLVTYSKHLQ